MYSEIQSAGMIGGQEILIILLVVLIFFGGKKIPELMKGLGKGMREYKKAVNNVEEQFSDENFENQEFQSQKKSSVSEDNKETNS